MPPPNNKPPPKTVLLTSCGLYPQIITEIIYALSQKVKPVIPSEIHVITTEVGLDNIKSQLLDKTSGFFHRLCREYKLNDTEFELNNIQLLRDAKGVPLDDIETLDDNEIVADVITETVRKLTARDDIALHVSLTGGRRTISYYLGYALSLFGREQDRLSHTIVSDGFEADDEFFYPNKAPTYITDREGNTLNTQDAKVQLVEIPFVRLRNGLPRDLLTGKTTFTRAVASVPKIVKTAQVEVFTPSKKIICNDIEVKLTPIQFAWYSWILSRVKQFGIKQGAIKVRGELHIEFIQHFKTCFSDNHANVLRTTKAITSGFDINYLCERNNGVNKRLRDALGYHTNFLIASFGRRPDTRYTVNLEPENILFEPT